MGERGKAHSSSWQLDPPDNRKQSGTNYGNASKVRLDINRYNLSSYRNGEVRFCVRD
jgi:hypothetical protein